MKDYRGIAQMTFQNRFFPATMRAKQLVEAGALGQILEFRVCYLHGGNADPDAPLRWRHSAAAGGGVIADLASHVLDLVDWLIGPFQAVAAATRIAYPWRPAAGDPAARVAVDVEDTCCCWRGCNRGPWARSRPRSSPPAARTKSAWRFTAPAARCGSTA